MWQWLQGPFLTTVASPNAAEQGYVLEFNKILGKYFQNQTSSTIE